MKAIVIGSGIGGLTAAIALHKAGIEAHAYERAPALREVGAGISLWANALHALDKQKAFVEASWRNTFFPRPMPVQVPILQKDTERTGGLSL